MTMKTLLSLGIIAIAAISVSSCESGKARVAKMEQISINGSNYGLELLHDDYLILHPEGSNGHEGYWFEHDGGPGGPIYTTDKDWSRRATKAMFPQESFEDGEIKSLVFNLDLKKIIFTTEQGTYFRVFPTQELVVPGGKVHGVILTAYHPMNERIYHRKVYTLDGVLRYDIKNNLGVLSDIVIEGGYIYLAERRYEKLPEKMTKIFPDGRQEEVPYKLRDPDPEKSVTGGSWEEGDPEVHRRFTRALENSIRYLEIQNTPKH
jgi:hypothetical protein